MSSDDQSYYADRASSHRELARNAADQTVAAIHAELARLYDELAMKQAASPSTPAWMAQGSATRRGFGEAGSLP